MCLTYRLFLFFSIAERIRKGSDLPKKNGGGGGGWGVTEHPTNILAHQVNTKVISSMFLLSFDSVRALEIHDVARRA